jgi:hypothetical protein
MLVKLASGIDSDIRSSSLEQSPFMFLYRRQLRLWAARVLLLWLFGLGTSVANACLTTGQSEPVTATASRLVAMAEALDDLAFHDHAPADGGFLPSHNADAQVHQGSLAKTNCQDFCGKALVSIPPLNSALDDLQAHAVIATAAVTVVPMPALAPVQLWLPRRDVGRNLPIPIAFLRLAL